METIRNVSISELHDFRNHPFKVEKNMELCELMRSIEKEGVLVPLLVRMNPYGGGYEIISGHRRKEAAIWAGETEVPIVIRELDDDQELWRWWTPICTGRILSRVRRHLPIE
jgi:ParB family chromosome partitioning protein